MAKPLHGLRPAATGSFYTQTGATFSQINNSFSASGVGSLSETIPLVVSPVPIAYELNVLSDTGDWYQITVGDNWPGCSGGFEELTEIWDSSGATGTPTCNPTVTLAKGNLVELSAVFTASHQVCLDLNDLTTGRSTSTCGAQPDSGGSQWVFLGSSSNSNGYYTGTMTEVLNETISSCPSYTDLPTVTFDFPSWVQVTGYVPWSDEFELGGSLCYSTAGPQQSLSSTDPASDYYNAAGTSSFANRWIEGQLDNVLNSSIGLRVQSDPKPLGTESLSASTTHPWLGESIALTSSASGGVSPYTTLMQKNGVLLQPAVTSPYTFSTMTPGNYSFVAYGVDAQGDVSHGSTAVTIVEPYPLRAGPVGASTGKGADVGQSVTFSSKVTGGLGWVRDQWSGLPAGCAAANQSSISCAPSTALSTTIGLTVDDSNGTVVVATSLAFTVSSRLTISLPTTPTVGDIGQNVAFLANRSGGAPPFAYTWLDLPSTCSTNATIAACALNGTGPSAITVEVRDGNSNIADSPTLLFITNPALRIGLTVSLSVADVGSPLRFVAVTSGGAGGAVDAWSDLPAGCLGTPTGPIDCRPTTPGAYDVNLSAVDLAGQVAYAPIVGVDIDPALSLHLDVTLPGGNDSGTVAFAPHLTGGSPISSIDWRHLPMGCVPNGLSPLTCSNVTPGRYSVTLEVRDAGGGDVNATVAFVETAALPPSPPSILSGTSLPVLPLAVLGVSAAIVVLVAALARRRRAPKGPA